MSHFTALYDACVLYPAIVRDLLMRLATTGMFRAKWSQQIHEEWISALLEDRPDLSRERLERTAQLMNAHAPDCLVEGYEALIDALNLPDPDDRHVLAAAIKGRASVIVTYDLKHFPVGVLATYDLEAQHPDEFASHLIDLHPPAVVHAVKKMRASLTNPSYSPEQLIGALEARQLVETASFLRKSIDFL